MATSTVLKYFMDPRYSHKLDLRIPTLPKEIIDVLLGYHILTPTIKQPSIIQFLICMDPGDSSTI